MPPKRALPVYVTPAELHRILEACENDRDRLMLELLWNTGARISEIVAVRVGDLTRTGVRLRNLKQGIWRQKPDGAREHVSVAAEKHVLLHPSFHARVRAACKGMSPQDAIFGRLADGKPMTRKRAWEIITGASSRAGVLKRRFGESEERPAWPHCLRHGYACLLLENHVPVTVVMEQLGHSSLASTQVYTRIVDPRKEELIAGVKF